MAQEDQIQRSSNSSGSSFLFAGSNSGSSSKKPKQRKAPQRGLGVAQLEKIRLEEQQNKDVSAVASPSILSSPSLPILNHPHSNRSSLSISFPSVSQADLSSSNSMTRMPFPAQSVDFGKSVILPLVNQTSYTGFEAPWPGITVLGKEDGPKMWNSCEYVKRGNDGADPGLPFQSNVFLPYQSNFSCPPIQFTQESSFVSVNSASATLSSSMLNFPMEPPSNQNYHYDYLTTQCPEEDKICGVKRPYPFSLDNPSGLSSNYQSHTSIPIRSDTSALNENSGSFRNLNFRDSPSYSTSTFAPNKKKCYTENSVGGDFLTLASPSADPAFRYHELPDFESLPFQSSDEVLTSKSEQSSLPFYSFIPPPADVTHISHDASKNSEEIEDSVDLNLKL